MTDHHQDQEPSSSETPPTDPASTIDKPLVSVVMGSSSDWDTLQHAVATLEQMQIPHEYAVVSAHRTPRRLYQYAEEAVDRGLRVIIAGAGGAAHLPGMLASLTPLPVLGVPVPSKALNGMDSLLSIVQMPAGIPVPTFAIGKAGAVNAALTATAILALNDPLLRARLDAFRMQQADTVLQTHLPPDKK